MALPSTSTPAQAPASAPAPTQGSPSNPWTESGGKPQSKWFNPFSPRASGSTLPSETTYQPQEPSNLPLPSSNSPLPGSTSDTPFVENWTRVTQEEDPFNNKKI